MSEDVIFDNTLAYTHAKFDKIAGFCHVKTYSALREEAICRRSSVKLSIIEGL